MKDIDLLFLMLTLFNTNMGLSNSSKNDKQEEILKEINYKLDKLLEMTKNE